MCLKKVNPPWDEQCRSQPCSVRSPPPIEGQARPGVPTPSQPGCSSRSNTWDGKHDLRLHQGQKSINIPSRGSCRAACWSWTALQTVCKGLPQTPVQAHSSRGGLHHSAFHWALVRESVIQTIAPLYSKLPFFIETEYLTGISIFGYLCLPEGEEGIDWLPLNSSDMSNKLKPYTELSTWSHLWVFQNQS